MTHSQLFRALRHCVNVHRPAFISGEPGIGKTSGVTEFFGSIGYEVWTESAVHYDPTDLKGIPSIHPEGYTKWLPPEFIWKLARNGRPDHKVCLFYSDLPVAPPMVQAALYRLMLEHRVGDDVLPDTVYICADGNRMADAAAVHQMPTPLRNRLVHLDLEPSPEDWIKWAVNADIQPELIGFIKFRPELLHKFDKKEYAFPTPRSWSFVSQLMADNPEHDIEFELYAGCVGKGAATEVMGFLRLFRELPSIDEILMHPKKAPVPKDPGTRYAVASALARAANKVNLKSVIEYSDRLDAEFAVFTIQQATGRDASLMRNTTFIEWGTRYGEFLRGGS